MEIGDGQARQVESLLAQTHHFSDIELHLDLFGKERFVSARRAAFPT
jgi:methylase of polypeptide subunit release factors